jgi:hypothetical protein
MYLAEDLNNFQTRTTPGSEHDLDDQGRRHVKENTGYARLLTFPVTSISRALNSASATSPLA